MKKKNQEELNTKKTSTTEEGDEITEKIITKLLNYDKK